MFRNARIYRLKSDWPDSEATLSEKLTAAGFVPCGPLTERSSGFMEIDTGFGESLARRLNGADLLKLRTQSRVLPTAVINEALEERVEEYRQRMDEPPGRREKRRLKAETRESLLPKALLKSDKTWGYVDLGEKLIMVDAGNAAATERFMLNLKMPFGDLVTAPLKFKKPMDELLKGVFMGNGPQGIQLGRECIMADATDLRSKVRWTDFDLTDKSIRAHVADGMRLTHLGIEYNNVMSCVLNEDGYISKIRFVGEEKDEAQSDADPLARFDANFVLLTGTLRALIKALKENLGGYA
ncbi:MAG: recombination-associated protein RdgC [Gammaproteobacteria bacterium]